MNGARPMSWTTLAGGTTRRVLGRVLAVACCVSVMAGCASGATGGSGVKTGGTLTAALWGEPDQLDPHITVYGASFFVAEEIFDTLVTFDDNQKIQPSLASSWTISSDQMTYTFNLRKAKWSDGTDFTAADVVYSFEREIQQKLPWASKLSSVSSVTVAGPSKVVLQLTQPDSALLLHLGGFKDQAIVQKSNVESGAIKDNPVGTGPFKLASWQHGAAITLVPNPFYWGTKPNLSTVKFTFVTDPAVALQDLQSGEVQWTNNLPKQSVKSLEASSPSGFVVKSVAGTEYDFISINMQHKPFDDVRVRQAISYAIDRGAIVKAAQFGNATVNETAIPKSSPWFYDYSPYSFDPAKAKALLAAAGVQNLTAQMVVSTAWAPAIATAQVVASELGDVGITVKIRQVDDGTYFAMVPNGQFDLTSYAWIFDMDPSDFYSLQQHCQASFNFQHYCDPSVDQDLDQAHGEPDFNKRKNLYDQAAKLIVDETGYLYLYNVDVVQGYSTKLHGYDVRGDGMVRFMNSWLS